MKQNNNDTDDGKLSPEFSEVLAQRIEEMQAEERKPWNQFKDLDTFDL